MKSFTAIFYQSLLLMTSLAISTHSILGMKADQKKRRATFISSSEPTSGGIKKTRIIIYRSSIWKHAENFNDDGPVVEYLRKKVEEGRRKIITINKKEVNNTDMSLDYKIVDSVIEGAVGPWAAAQRNYEVFKIQELIAQAVKEGITDLHFWTFDLGYLPFPIVSQALAIAKNNKRLRRGHQVAAMDPDVIRLAHRRVLAADENDSPVLRTTHGHSADVEEYTPKINIAELANKRRISVISHSTLAPQSRCNDGMSFTPVRRESLQFDDSSDDVEFVRSHSRSFNERYRGDIAFDLNNIVLTIYMFGDMPEQLPQLSTDLGVFACVRHFPQATLDTFVAFPVEDKVESSWRCCGPCRDGWGSLSKKQKEAAKEFMCGCAKVALGLVVSAVSVVFPPAAAIGLPLVVAGVGQAGKSLAANLDESDRTDETNEHE